MALTLIRTASVRPLLIAASVLLCSSLFGQIASDLDQVASKTTVITGVDAETLYGILSRAKFPPSNDGALGSTSVSTDSAYCTRVVYPGALAQCKLTKAIANVPTEKDFANHDADDLQNIITKYLGLRPNEEVGVGVAHAASGKIVCSRPVVLRPKVTCIMWDYSQPS